jgi:predicted MPP superfamily phosphohydrolase
MILERRRNVMHTGIPTLAAPISNVEEKPVSPVALKPRVSPAHFTWRRLAVFASIVSTILLAANAVVCATWSYFFNLPGWIAWQALTGVLALVFIPATILRFRSDHPALKIVYALSASWLGALNFAFFAAVACWITEAVVWLAGWPLPRFQLAAAWFGLAFLATACGLINARWIRVSRITVHLPHLPARWQRRTAALVTDLHLGPLSGARFLRRVIARLRSLQPDLVFISGDMFDGPTHGLDSLVEPWREFTPDDGIFYVTGNHDEFAERSLYLDPVRRVGIQVLDNAMVSLDGLQLVGVHDSEAGDAAELRSILRGARIDRQRPSILLAHRPVNLAMAEEAGISLQLSGHTHRGQIWPWNLMVSKIYGRFAYGLGRLGKMQVYTSSGVGTWGPPLRLGTRSEIVLIRFE